MAIGRLVTLPASAVSLFPLHSHDVVVERLRNSRRFFKQEIELKETPLTSRFRTSVKRRWHKPYLTGPLQETMWKRRIDRTYNKNAFYVPPIETQFEYDDLTYHSIELLEATFGRLSELSTKAPKLPNHHGQQHTHQLPHHRPTPHHHPGNISFSTELTLFTP